MTAYSIFNSRIRTGEDVFRCVHTYTRSNGKFTAPPDFFGSVSPLVASSLSTHALSNTLHCHTACPLDCVIADQRGSVITTMGTVGCNPCSVLHKLALHFILQSLLQWSTDQNADVEPLCQVYNVWLAFAASMLLLQRF